MKNNIIKVKKHIRCSARCDSIVGISFRSWFIDENIVADSVESLWVAGNQLDLWEYHHKYEEDVYVLMEGFSENEWSKYVVYTP